MGEAGRRIAVGIAAITSLIILAGLIYYALWATQHEILRYVAAPLAFIIIFEPIMIILSFINKRIAKYLHPKRLRRLFLEDEIENVKISLEIDRVYYDASQCTRYELHKTFSCVSIRMRIDNDSILDLEPDSISLTIYANRYPLYRCDKIVFESEPRISGAPDAIELPRKIPERQERVASLIILIPHAFIERRISILIAGSINFKTKIGLISKDIFFRSGIIPVSRNTGKSRVTK